MLSRYSFLYLVLPVALLIASVSIVWGQDATADQAKALLQQGLDQYKALNFKEAKATLLKVDPKNLSDAEKKQRDDTLAAVDTKVLQQTAAREACANAEKAEAANDLAKAKEGFAVAAASDLLPVDERDKAKQRLAQVEEKIKVAAAAKAASQEAPKPAPPALPMPDPVKPAVEAPKPADTGEVKVVVAVAPETKPAPVAPKPVVDAPKPAPVAPPKPAAEAPKPAPVSSGPPAVTPKPVAAPKPAPATAAIDQQKMLAEAQARRAKVQELLDAGKIAMDNNEGEKAIAYFDRALQLDPQSAEAQRLLIQARSQITTSGGSGILNRMDQRRQIAKQETDVQFEKAMTSSQEALAGAKAGAAFDKALSDARVSKNILETNKSLYPDDEYREKNIKVDQQIRFIDLKRSEWERTAAKEQLEAMKKAEATREVREEDRRQKRIASLTVRAKALRDQRKNKEALEVYEEILKIDPSNAPAAEWKEYLEQSVILDEESGLVKTRNSEQQKTLLDIRESEIPWYDLLRYPRDWKEITARREGIGAATSAETDADRAIRLRLKAKISKLEFDDIEFKDVIQFLRDVSGLSIHVKWSALTLAGIDKGATVNVHLADVSMEKALRVILDDIGGGTAALSYVVEDGVITISTKEDLSKHALTRVYDIRDMIVRVPNFKGPRIDIAQVGQQSGQNASQGSSTGRGLFDTEETGSTTGGGRLDRTEGELKSRDQVVNDIMSLIKETIDPTSWRTSGGDVGSVRELSGQLVVTQTAENHDSLLKLISQLREARALQINIEARFITVSTGFLNRVGLDLDFYFNLGSKLGAAATGANPNQSFDPFTATTIDPTTGAVIRNPVNPQVNNGSWNSKSANNHWTPIGVQQSSSPWTSSVDSGITGGINSGVGGIGTNHGLGIAGTFLDDIQVDFLMEATQADQSSRVMTAPRITLFNGQRAYITVSTQRAYVANFEPVVAENSSALRPIVGYVPTGTVLDVEATVSADRRYVTLTVRPQVANLEQMNEISFFIAAGSPVTIQLPTIALQDLQTTVSVPDGGTLLLGGQKDAGEMQREMGAPILNKVPILNRLFSNRADVRDQKTLLILIKPKIIIQREEEERSFP